MTRLTSLRLPGVGDAIGLLRKREISAVELMRWTLSRVKRYDSSINSIVVRDFERAERAALAADLARANGDDRLLLGLPVTVKESFNVRGMRTTWGIPAFRDYLPSFDSLAVRRMELAGAIVFGKSNISTALSDWQCDNPIYGTTRNPWDMSRTAGGSSGGGAAALCAGLSFLELGSDSVGSIRIPAHFCGVCGHRPTPGVIPTEGYRLPGSVALSDFSVVGPMARTVDDLLVAFACLVERHPTEALAAELRLPGPKHERVQDYRVLLLENHPLADTCESIRGAIRGLADRLASSGVRVSMQHRLVPDLAETARVFTRQMMSQNLARLPEELYRRERDHIARGDMINDHWLSIGREGIAGNLRQWFADVERRTVLAGKWRDLFDDWDIVVMPASTTEAFHHNPGSLSQRYLDVDGAQSSYLDHIAWASPASLAGLPATTLPIGVAASGMPIGVQCMSTIWADYTTLSFARHVEILMGGGNGRTPGWVNDELSLRSAGGSGFA